MPVETRPDLEPIYPTPRVFVGAEVLDMPEPEWLLEDFIQAGGLTVLHGVPAAGKSLLAQDWAMVVSNGWEWCGRETKRSNVLYIMGEGQQGLRGRILAWQASRGADYVPSVHWVMEAVSLWSPPTGGFTPEQKGLLKYVADHDIGLVVADTLSATFGGGNENMQQDMNQYLMWFKTLLDGGAAAVIVHHEAKREAGPRGSTVLAGAADTLIRVEPVFDRDGETMLGCVLRCRKQKDGMPFGRIRMKLESYPVETQRGSSVVLRPQSLESIKEEQAARERADELIEYVSSRPGVSWNAVVNALKGKKTELMKLRDSLIEDGMLEWGPNNKGLFTLRGEAEEL